MTDNGPDVPIGKRDECGTWAMEDVVQLTVGQANVHIISNLPQFVPI